MYLYFAVLNTYLRSFFFFIDTNNIWHWRLPLQGLLNELVAAGLFYLIFRILFSIITTPKLRKVLLALFVTTWIIINYINYQYANTFNALLPFSWFYELNNFNEIGGSGDILLQNADYDMIYLVLLPFFFSIYFIFRLEHLWEKTRKRDVMFIFLISVFFQSSTLYADIQPRVESIVHSHLIKYWYYGYDEKRKTSQKEYELNSISKSFINKINETIDDKPLKVPIVTKDTNVVLIIMESFRAYDIGAYGSKLNLSPYFDKYAEEGILFENIYSSFNLSKVGMWETLCGAHQNVKGGAVFTHFPDHEIKCIYDYFNDINYETVWIHGQSATYDSQGYFMNRHQVKHIYDRLSFPVDSEILGWGLSDREVFQFSLDLLKEMKDPFFAVIQTMTNHHPYVVPADYNKDYGFDEQLNKFFSTFQYSDEMLGKFLNEFIQTNNGKNSLIIITADHGNGKSLKKFNQKERLKILNQYHIPLLILYPKNQKNIRRKIDAYGGQVDIMPTIMDIMNMKYDFPMFGKSLVRNFKHRYVKGNIEGGWLIYDERFISMRHKKSPSDVFGNPLSVNETDQEWTDLFNEIDDLQHWMVQQKSKENLLKKLSQLGWKY